jgi:hypothetical protein
LSNLQDNVNLWFKTLNNIKNFSSISNYPKVKEALDFIFYEIESIK